MVFPTIYTMYVVKNTNTNLKHVKQYILKLYDIVSTF